MRDASLHSSHWEKAVSDGQYEVTRLPIGLWVQCERRGGKLQKMKHFHMKESLAEGRSAQLDVQC